MGEEHDLCASVLSALDEGEVAALHLDRQFPIDAVLARELVSEHVIQNEKEAENIMDRFSEDVGAEPAAFIRFQRSGMKVSSVRMAVFTGRRFLYSSVGSSAALAERRGADLECAVPELELFLQVIRGAPPEGVSLRSAAGLFFVIEAAMARAVHGIWIQILQPLFKQLSRKQMAFIAACTMRVSLSSCLDDSTPLSQMISRGAFGPGVDGNKKDDHDDDRESSSDGENDGTDDGCLDDEHDDECLATAATFAIKLLSKAGCGGDSHGQLLLQVCRNSSTSVWLRIASVAATAQLEKEALLQGESECCRELQRVLENTFCDYSSVFAEACLAASHHYQRVRLASMMRVIMKHMTQLQQFFGSVKSGEIVDNAALRGAVGANASPQLTIQHLYTQPNGFLLCTRLRVAGEASQAHRSMKLSVVFRTAIKHGDRESEIPPHVPAVCVRLHNHHNCEVNVKYVLGCMPAMNVGRVACVLHELRNRFENGVDLESGIFCSTPVFMRSGKQKIAAMTRTPCRWMEGHALTHQKWQEVAEADWRDDSVKGKDLVAFCFLEENE